MSLNKPIYTSTSFSFWLTSSPIDLWKKWTHLLDCDKEIAEKAMELFINGVDDFATKIDWDLRSYELYVHSEPFAVGFKGDNNGTINVFTKTNEHRHVEIYHEFDCDWTIEGTAHTIETREKRIIFKY